LAKKAFVYDGSQWVDIAQSTTDLSNYANLTTTPISGFRNAIINGDFRIWQRGSSFTPATGGGTYTADRWATTFSGGTPTNSVARTAFNPGIASTLGVEAEYFYKSTITSVSTATRYSVEQRIEDVRTFAGQTVTLSFWAKTDTNRSPSVFILQNFGTGGSGQVVGGSQIVPMTTSWERYTVTTTLPSISGKTIGTASNLTIRFDQTVAAGSVLDLWGVQLEEGSIATPFEQRPVGTELALCQRYYYGSPYIVKPYVIFNSGNVMSGTFQFPVTMRVAPATITYSDGLNAVGKISIANAGGTAQNNITPPNSLTILNNGWNFGAGGMTGTTGNNGNIMLGSYQASAEL
jgi:hypothetical protein